MLKHGEVNPLNVFGLREVQSNCPPHFVRVPFDLRTNEKKIKDWIWEHLDGRFWMGDYYYTDGATVQSQKCAAFEIHSEASYFSLLLDQINKFEDIF